MANIGQGWSPGQPSALPTGLLPGETPEQYAYRKFQEQRYLEQQAEQRAYNEYMSEWANADARAYGQYMNADSRAYGEMLNAEGRAYGEWQNADSRAYNEARQQQSRLENQAYQRASMDVNIARELAQNESNILRSRVGMAERQAAQNRANRQPIGGITEQYRRVLGGY